MTHAEAAMSTAVPKLLVIMGSVRIGRICPYIAAWVIDIGRSRTGLDCELVDLAEWPLSARDEPGIPALGQYAQDTTIAWSRKVSSAAAFVIVTPEFNAGYPAALKNAIDHLYHEWTGKPVAIVSYGRHGGHRCAAQLRQITDGLRMRTVATTPAVTLTAEMIHGGPVDAEVDFIAHAGAVGQAFDELVEALQPAVA